MRTKTWIRPVLIGVGMMGCFAVAEGQVLSVALKTTATVEGRCGVPQDPITTKQVSRPVDLVICLDTSGSMTALIDSARAKLWDIVNTLAVEEPNATLRVGLLTYGSPNRSDAARGWIVMQTNLTSDLDTVYAKMMAITTNGGDEFVGWVLNDALRRMNWSRHPRAVKMIFVAGNESADQAANYFNFRTVAQDARREGIVINSIYGGGYQQGITEHWDQVALHGGGNYSAIDMQAGTDQIATPYDRMLIELNVELNATYVPYGQAGLRGRRNQEAQDANAARMGGQSAASRVVAKSTKLYENARWDLVDSRERGDFDLSKVRNEDLPKEMRGMTTIEQTKYLEKKKTARTGIQKRIQEISVEREVHIKKERTRKGTKANALDDAMKEAIRKQLKENK